MTGEQGERAHGRSLLRRILSSPWAHLAMALLAVAVVQSFFVKVYQVPSSSMEQTLQTDGVNSDRVLVDRLAYANEDPVIGDVVVFNADSAWAQPQEHGIFRSLIGWVGDVFGFGPSNTHALVKRVIAGPGDVVTCCNAQGEVLVNGTPLSEPYVFEDFPFEESVVDCESLPVSSRCFHEIAVPDEQYFVLGDHRSNSADSAVACRRAPNADGSCARFVSRESIVGKTFLVVYPFTRWDQELSVGQSGAD